MKHVTSINITQTIDNLNILYLINMNKMKTEIFENRRKTNA